MHIDPTGSPHYGPRGFDEGARDKSTCRGTGRCIHDGSSSPTHSRPS